MNELTEKEGSLLLKLQQGIPLQARPFAVFAETLDMSEADVLGCIEKFFENGRARRMGGVFDARRLGYRSMLCAVDIPQDAVEKLMPVLVSHPGITHCYERSWPQELPETLTGGPAGREHVPNIWFTLAVNHETFDADIAKLSAALAPYKILQLPALRRFKIDVIFDPGHRKKREEYPGIPRGADSGTEPEKFPLFTEQEKEIVRILDKNMPRVGNPYEVIAAEVGIAEDELLLKLNRWKESGVIRRMAMIVYHHRLGFKANAMCVWHIDESRVNEAGRIRDAMGDGFVIVTPGIRPAGAVLGDQKRVATPRAAIDAGSDYLVIGRPIYQAESPGAAADSILAEMGESGQ